MTLPVGYKSNEIEPGIAPLVSAARAAGYETFSSCEGHAETNGVHSYTSIGFFASEEEALRVD